MEQKLIITAVVKINNEWLNPGAEIEDISDELRDELINKGLAAYPKSQQEVFAEWKSMRAKKQGNATVTRTQIDNLDDMR